MSKVMDTSQWIVFFRKAGLPTNVAANYALIFADNRIQVDMLLDLSKEYLYDMGIKVMGDVIAILKYAKEFHNQLAKERIIGSPVMPHKTVVAERVVGRYTRPIAPPPPPPIQQRVGQINRELPRKSTVISLKRKSELESIKKVRRVPPEEEGAYKIKMPKGITERTRRILQQQQAQGTKRSVFARLGDSEVASSVFQRLGPSSKSDDLPSSTVSSFQVPKKKDPPLPYRGVLKMTVGKSRTVTTNSPSGANFSSRTVIKPGALGKQIITKTVQLNHINAVRQANKSLNTTVLRTVKQPRSQGIFGLGIATRNVNIKSRLGGNGSARNVVRTNILLKKARMPVKSPSNVFERLGR